MKNEEYAKKLLEGSEECFILATDKGVGIVGNGAEVLSCVSMIIREAKKHLPENVIRHAVDLGCMSDEQLMTKFLNKSNEE